jgi:hypothetical protein
MASVGQPLPVAMIRVDVDHDLDALGDELAVVLTIQGTLDRDAGAALVDATRTAAGGGAPRIDIDLRSVTSFTDEGARSLLRCRELCGALLDGLHYRTGQGPGREALLTAYAEEPAG